MNDPQTIGMSDKQKERRENWLNIQNLFEVTEIIPAIQIKATNKLGDKIEFMSFAEHSTGVKVGDQLRVEINK
jgi:hypothetical protein